MCKTVFKSIKNDRYTKPSFVAEKTDAENKVEQEEPVKLKSIVIDLTPKESKEPHTDYTEYIGKEFEYENRKYKIDSINEGTVSAQDMTMLETSRYPIFRVLDTETVLGIIREQPSEKEKTLSDYTLSSDDYSDLGGENHASDITLKQSRRLKPSKAKTEMLLPMSRKCLRSMSVGAGFHRHLTKVITPGLMSIRKSQTCLLPMSMQWQEKTQ